MQGGAVKFKYIYTIFNHNLFTRLGINELQNLKLS